MNLASESYPFELLTPCLCHGASPEGPAEMRVASIRGQIRQWHRTVAEIATVNRIWGAAEGQNVGASEVSVCLDRHETNAEERDKAIILPHKGGAKRCAIPAEHRFALTLRRLPGCTAADWTTAQNAVKLWLLIGGLGLRCNRAAGSVWPTGDWTPKTEAELARTLKQLGCRWPVSLADAALGSDATALRGHASDTVDGHPDVFGEIPRRDRRGSKRLPSPTRMKVIRLGGQYRLLLAASRSEILDRARQLLAGKPLGRVSWQGVCAPSPSPSTRR